MKPLRVFIIQPFGTSYAQRFRELISEVCSSEELRGSFEPFQAMDQPTIEPRLQDRINSYIRDADLCVADLTGPGNANALLEVGAAYALEIPVIPFSDKELPSDIRGNLYVNLELIKL